MPGLGHHVQAPPGDPSTRGLRGCASSAGIPDPRAHSGIPRWHPHFRLRVLWDGFTEPLPVPRGGRVLLTRQEVEVQGWLNPLHVAMVGNPHPVVHHGGEVPHPKRLHRPPYRGGRGPHRTSRHFETFSSKSSTLRPRRRRRTTKTMIRKVVVAGRPTIASPLRHFMGGGGSRGC